MKRLVIKRGVALASAWGFLEGPAFGMAQAAEYAYVMGAEALERQFTMKTDRRHRLWRIQKNVATKLEAEEQARRKAERARQQAEDEGIVVAA